MLLVLLACAATVAVAPAEQPSAGAGLREYLAVIDRYRQGDIEGALAAIAGWPWTGADFQIVGHYWRVGPTGSVREAAALLHFEAAIRLDYDRAREKLATRHLEFARRLGGSDRGFQPLFDLAVIGYLHGQLRVGPAHDATAHALGKFPDDPELLLAYGSVVETFLSPLGRGLRRPAGLALPHPLVVAVESFRKALKIDPTLAEARVRLGAALLRLERPKDAIRELDSLDARELPGFLVYLRALVLGAAHEELGAFETAAEQYRQAIAAYPEAQTGYIALMHLLQKRGDRAAARDVLDRWNAAGQAAERGDPWWVYWRGQFWLLEHRLKKLRSVITARR